VRLWRWWLDCTSREIDPLPLALVRVLVPLAIVFDLLQAARLGMVTAYWRTADAGGLSRFSGENAFVDDLSPLWGGPLTWLVCVISMSLASLGIATRPAILIGLLAYAQLGHLYPPGDRAIDRLLRTVLLVLLFSGAHRRLSLWQHLRGIPAAIRIPAWSSALIRYILVLMYLGAGFHKIGSDPGWLNPNTPNPIYRILTDPLAGKLDPMTFAGWHGVSYALSVGTIALECTGFLILTRHAPRWAVLGATMHLGIAVTMHLGMFSWGMLSLYPLLFAPWIIRRWGLEE
jgi:hypothetical protein